MSKEINEAQYVAFLLELRELTRKHGIAIDGCGCCDSPFLWKPDVIDDRAGYRIDDDGSGNLTWRSPEHARWRIDWPRVILPTHPVAPQPAALPELPTSLFRFNPAPHAAAAPHAPSPMVDGYTADQMHADGEACARAVIAALKGKQ